MIGLSLGICVAHILRGVVREDAVVGIVASTMFSSPQEAVAHYMRPSYYWDKFPAEEVTALVERLWGRIVQPRFQNPQFCTDCTYRVWVSANTHTVEGVVEYYTKNPYWKR